MPEPSENPPGDAIHLFLDESGTSASDQMTLVGATAFRNVAAAERAVKAAYDRALGDRSLWPNSERRRQFSETGFHFAEDSESVRQVLLAELTRLDFRAYVAYAARPELDLVTDKLVAMYGTMLSSVLARYRNESLSVVFEENSSMNALYGKLWNVLREDIGMRQAQAFLGSKVVPCLAVTDYVLGVARVHLSGDARDFQTNRYVALGRNLAYLIDYDDDRHLGGSRHPIV